MKYASVGDTRKEPSPKLKGKCLGCGDEVIAKCGNQRIWHWSHLNRIRCDPWWENETPWHRDWKNRYPQDWQEIYNKDSDGIIHRADIKRPDGFYIEFQYSPIAQDEIESRNVFYKNLVWVVNGCRSQLDVEKTETFPNHTDEKGVVDISQLGLLVVKKWKDQTKPIFIDFEDLDANGEKRIFYLITDGKYHFLIEILVETFVSLTSTSGAMKDFVQNAKEKASDTRSKVIKDEDKLKKEKIEAERKRREWEKIYVDPFRKLK